MPNALEDFPLPSPLCTSTTPCRLSLLFINPISLTDLKRTKYQELDGLPDYYGEIIKDLYIGTFGLVSGNN